MYAIVKSGGKQCLVTTGQTLKFEKLSADVGDVINFEQVLMIVDGENSRIGTPFLQGVKIVAEVVEQGRDSKIDIIKFKRRKHHMKRQGHRQYFTKVKITGIEA